MAGIQESEGVSSFNSSVVLDDGRIVDDVTVEYYYEPEEPAEQGYPGAPAEAHIEGITYNGNEIELDEIANLDDLRDEALEAANRAAQDDYDARGDHDMEQQRERRYHEALEVDETATGGSSSAGGIASVPGIGGKSRAKNSHPGTTVGSDKYTGY